MGHHKLYISQHTRSGIHGSEIYTLDIYQEKSWNSMIIIFAPLSGNSTIVYGVRVLVFSVLDWNYVACNGGSCVEVFLKRD